jgi:hypothetical protein
MKLQRGILGWVRNEVAAGYIGWVKNEVAAGFGRVGVKSS